MHKRPPAAILSHMNPHVQVFDDADTLADHAVRRIVEVMQASLAARGRCTLCLAGGTTPAKTYARLPSAGEAVGLDWSAVYFFFGDERLVPPTDPWSNYELAQQSFLARLAAMPMNVFPMPTGLDSPQRCAEAYEETLSRFFAAPRGGPPPRFDLVLLGLGDDGHTASLFPGAAALDESQHWVVATPPGRLPPQVDRLTLTFPVLNAARQVMFLVAGANKAPALRDALRGDDFHRVPAAGVRPAEGQLVWLADRAAAGLVEHAPSEHS